MRQHQYLAQHMTRRLACRAALLAVVFSLTCGTAPAADTDSAAKEQQLIGVLQSGTKPEKAITCKQLAIHGSKAAVPELAKLLADVELASWARIALEAIPDPAADEALRGSLDSLQGLLAVGAINSIGVRRDAGAVDKLTGRLKDADSQVASAAAVALGRVGNAAATQTLRQSLAGAPVAVRSAVAEGCILCAERLMAEGQHKQAAEIFDEVRKADVPQPRKLEATRGAILARKTDGIPLLVEQLKSSDRDLMRIGLAAARELPGREVADALAAELAKTTPDRAALLLYAMADRQDSVVSPAVLEAARKGEKQVQIAAITVISHSGDAASVATLLDLAASDDAELAQAAKTALADLPGEKINADITARLAQADGKPLTVLIEIVGQRRIAATPALVKRIDSTDATVRAAALLALGETISPQEVSILINQVLAPKNPDDAKVATRALLAACVRMPDREACATDLAAVMPRASTTSKKDLITVLGAMGGPKALATIAAAMAGGDDALQDVGSKLLGEWMTADAAPVLLEQARTASGEKYQLRALRGYIRITRQFIMPDKERAEMCQRALQAAGRNEEQKLILAVLQRYPHMDTLAVATGAAALPGLKQDAEQTALAIAQKLGDKPEVREVLAKINLEPVKVEIVKAEYGAGATQRDVTNVLQRKAQGLTIITLPTSYNEALGGDPLPGMAKQLKIQYRINGKPGEATFAENAAIVLPMPK